MYNLQAQSDNMELMDACLEKNVRLIDYERMCDESGNFFIAKCYWFQPGFFSSCSFLKMPLYLT